MARRKQRSKKRGGADARAAAGEGVRTARGGPLPAATPAPPPAWPRDIWLWISLLAVLPLVVHMWGAPWGVPVADDFDYLHRVMFSGTHTLLDGCGSIFYWRPLSRQIYFEALWRVILSHPAWVASLHLVVLAATSGILYRALRVSWPGSLAAVAATFPLFAESTRMLVTWPSNFQDLAAMFFAALAVHATVHRRLRFALLALLGSLFSKEVGVLTALLLPWIPQREPMPLRERLRWVGWTGGLVLAWGLAYLWVSHHAGLVLPSQLEQDPAALATPLPVRIGWALWNSARSAFSLPAIHVRGENMVWTALFALMAGAALIGALRPASRARLRSLAGWPAWGLLWFATAGATLLAIYPTWAAYRGIFAVIGLGITLTAIIGAAHPALLAGLVALRLLVFFAAPGPPAHVSSAAIVSGAAIDYPNLVRLQRLVGETRDLLQGEFPHLPHGALIGQHHLPLGSEWAYTGSKALQIWYADSTLRWVRFEDFRADTSLPLVTIVEYQTHGPYSVALVEPDAMRALLAAKTPILSSQWGAALETLTRAENEQEDPGAEVFLGNVVGMKGLALAGLGRRDEAESEARRALELWPENPDSRYVLAYLWKGEGRYAEAEAQLDTMLTQYPSDEDAKRLREQIREAARAAP